MSNRWRGHSGILHVILQEHTDGRSVTATCVTCGRRDEVLYPHIFWWLARHRTCSIHATPGLATRCGAVCLVCGERGQLDIDRVGEWLDMHQGCEVTASPSSVSAGVAPDLRSTRP